MLREKITSYGVINHKLVLYFTTDDFGIRNDMTINKTKDLPKDKHHLNY